ncbi:ATP-binding protein [Acidithiobacillus sp.]|uniref:ATP-binding protein n=1 Tax=Acidithiobacillus sp. TaxID=1872118 RepID=UPI003CFD6AA6
MAVKLRSTNTIHQDGVKVLVYGHAGAGKTSLIRTLPDPVIISVESGLLSIQDSDIPFIEVTDMESLKDAFEWLVGSTEASQFRSVAIDSLSEIAEVVLSDEKRTNKDGRAAYGEMATKVTELVRGFRDINGKHVYFSAKCEKQADETGRILYSPGMPGAKLAQQIPYLVDEVLALRVEKDEEGKSQRALMCDSDGLWSAKDRSGRLDAWMAPDLGEIIKVIEGGKTQ